MTTQLTQENIDTSVEDIAVLEAQFGVSEENTVNPIIEMIDTLMSGELHESNSLFYDLIGFKLNEKIELKKIEVAQSIMGGVVESHDEDEDDNKSDEVGEDEEGKHPLVQLKKISSFTKNTPEENELLTKGGGIDKRKVNASTGPDKPETFKHKNGEESEISPEHAKHLVDILSGSGLKPDTKDKVTKAIHASKDSFEKVKGLLLAAKPKEKSIYGQDARTA